MYSLLHVRKLLILLSSMILSKGNNHPTLLNLQNQLLLSCF